MQDVCDKILDKNNDYIEEITGTKNPSHSDGLSKSGMELVYEAGKLSRKLATLEHKEFGLCDRVKIGLRLAAITLDVNHSLETLIYLLKAYHNGLIQISRHGIDPLLQHSVFDASILSLSELKLEIKQKPESKRSKSFEKKRSRQTELE